MHKPIISFLFLRALTSLHLLQSRSNRLDNLFALGHGLSKSSMGRVTRATAAKLASSSASARKASSKATSATTAEARAKNAPPTKKQNSKGKGNSSKTPDTTSLDDGLQSPGEGPPYPQGKETKEAANVGKKRKRPADDKVEDEYEELPHNMGRVLRAKKGLVKKEGLASAEPSSKGETLTEGSVKAEEHDEKNHFQAEEGVEISTGFREIESTNVSDAGVAVKSTPKKKSIGTSESDPASAKKPKSPKVPRTPKPPKTNEYGLTPGVSPFPDYPHPTPEECYEVHRVLKEHHPNCHGRPKTIPPPSQIVAGCGQVPSILDALIRTLLSAATTGKNSSSAYQGMVARYGNLVKGVGKGSVDYNAVRLAPQSDLEAAIASGGLAKAKSKNIKAILDMVYKENKERREAHLALRSNPEAAAAPAGANEETDEQKAAEVALAEEDVLSLDHYYSLPTYDAIFTFVKYPGIGVKTAACTALFCMQRDCFAVDTHAFRLAQWLGWVPASNKRVGRDTTFSHLEVRIPDELKYDLHQLFLKHGKTCPRCRASTGESSADWEVGCVIDHLVKRTGPRKGGVGSPSKKQGSKSVSAKKSKKKVKDSGSEDEDAGNMPMLNDSNDDDDDEPSMPDVADDEEYRSPLKATEKTPQPSSAAKSAYKVSKELPASTPSKSTIPKKSSSTTPGSKKRTSRAS